MRKRMKIALLACVLGMAAAGAGCGDPTNGVKPVATIEMDDGQKIVIELLPKYAPNTVANFISLAQSGFYDGVVFHRIIPDFMIQGGDPEGTGAGGPGYNIKGEFANNGHTKNTLKHETGVVSMARQGNPYDPKSAYNTAGSQFFIMVGDMPHLDKDYAAFGKVIEGVDVAIEISKGQTVGNNGEAVTPRVMKSVTVDTKGVDWPAPETIAK